MTDLKARRAGLARAAARMLQDISDCGDVVRATAMRLRQCSAKAQGSPEVFEAVCLQVKLMQKLHDSLLRPDEARILEEMYAGALTWSASRRLHWIMFYAGRDC